MSKKLKVGIVGFGKMGKCRHRFLSSHPNVDVVAICDPNEAVLLGNTSLNTYVDYRDLLKLPLDAVFVATTNDQAPVIVMDALAKKLHVFCEKPPGRSLEDIQMIQQKAAQLPSVKLKYGFNHRYHGSICKAKEVIESGRLGKPLLMRGVYGKSGGMHFAESWRAHKKSAGGGILLDQGIHMLDLFRYLGGEFHELHAFVENLYWDIDTEDNAFVMMRNKKGLVATLHSSATQWKHIFDLHITLTEGYLQLSGILSQTRSYGKETLVIGKREFEDSTQSLGNPQEEKIEFGEDLSWSKEIDEFIGAILNDVSIEHGTVQDALKTMEMIDKIYQSDRLSGA